MTMQKAIDILKAKIEYYGFTEAAVDFAFEEYLRQKYEVVKNVYIEDDVDCKLCGGRYDEILIPKE